MAELFISRVPTIEDYWRGIVLYGRNVASYKFALAKTLLELQPASGQLVKLSDLAPSFAFHITEHLKSADKQGTSQSSRFLDGCRDYNTGKITRDQLHELTVRFGFVNVIDAFHVVGQQTIPKRFFIDQRKDDGGIRITEEFSLLQDQEQIVNLPQEAEARWRLVETAWELGVSRNLMAIDYDIDSEVLFSVDTTKRRKSVTSSRDALNGYQKGKCFYCRSDIHIQIGSDLFPEVDHFFPHSLKHKGFGSIIDGVWNLVLACQDCNRGVGGKFDRVPSLKLLEQLHRRNEYLIFSNHPLRETIIMQTGTTTDSRRRFLEKFHERAWASLLHLWDTTQCDLL